MSRRKIADEQKKVKSAKLRLTELEYNQLDEVSKTLNLEKSFIIREAVKSYLQDKEIEIWC